jgi:hypothetical protein
MNRMMLHCHIPPTNIGMHIPSSSARPSSSGGHENRHTGQRVVSNGSANGRDIWVGPRGGLKYLNANGNWTYL